jgi:toxin secretion/phage lysis holin
MTWQDAFMEMVTGWLEALPMLGVLIVLMGLDVATGLVKAWVTKEISSSASLDGMLRKVMMLAIVAAGQCMEFVIPMQSLPWAALISSFFCVTELISITENAKESGVPLPEQIVDVLHKQQSDRRGKAPLVANLRVQVSEPSQNTSEDASR